MSHQDNRTSARIQIIVALIATFGVIAAAVIGLGPSALKELLGNTPTPTLTSTQIVANYTPPAISTPTPSPTDQLELTVTALYDEILTEIQQTQSTGATATATMLTAIAVVPTATPTPDARQTEDERVRQGAAATITQIIYSITATANAWTNTPSQTSTFAPSPTPFTPTERMILIQPLPQASATDSECQVQPPQSANIRSSPGTGYAIVGTATAGTAYRVVGQVANSSWWQIEYNGSQDWISNGVVSIIGDCGNIPTINVQVIDATPTLPIASTSPATSSCTPPSGLVEIGQYANWSRGIYTTRNVANNTVALGTIVSGSSGLTFTIWIDPCAVKQHGYYPGVRFWRKRSERRNNVPSY